MNAIAKILLSCATAFALLIIAGMFLPNWAMFLATIAFAKGLVALGIICLMRAGLVSFGQGLFYCIGAYVAAFMSEWTGITDIALLTVLGVITTALIGAIFGPLLAT